MSPFDWQVVAKSVRGASHERTGTINQDAVLYSSLETSPGVLLAVADGHGSRKSFRSASGAKFAVEAAHEVSNRIFNDKIDALSAEKRPESALKAWPASVLEAWKRRVETHLKEQPLQDTMAVRPADPRPESGPPSPSTSLGPKTYLVYGSTCLGTVVTSDVLFFSQLGDGDILTVDFSGKVERPLPKDERFIGNETASLCSPDALSIWRLRWVDLKREPAPAMVLMATDGYGNSFRDEAGFQKVASDIWEIVCHEGFETVSQELESWLTEASREGSGDDISVGLLCRLSAVQQAKAIP
jgi:hypothetical protein